MAAGAACVHRAHSSMCLLPPMDSSVSVMEPEDTPQLTPPALLALSTASSRVGNVTAGRPCTTGVGGRRATSEVQRALRCTSPVSRKEWLHTMQDEGHPAFESDMWISAAQIALHLPTQLTLKLPQTSLCHHQVKYKPKDLVIGNDQGVTFSLFLLSPEE